MVAPTSAEPAADPRVGTWSEPPCPLPPELRSDIAYRRASGHPWDAIGVSLHYSPDALRRATENDPEFAAVQEKAWAAVTWEGQADGMRRLRQLANYSEDEDRALKAAEVLVKYANERLRDENRLTVEQIRSTTRLEVEKWRTERAARAAEAEPVWVPPVPVKPETEEDRRLRVEWETAQDAVEESKKERPHVYVWGGKHPLGREVAPDESDTRVRIKADWSCGGGDRGTVYWVVPDPPPLLAAMPGEPDGPAAVAAWGAT